MLTDDPRCGTVQRFYQGCDCRECRIARSRDEKRRRWEAANGNPRRVDVTGSRRRLQALMRQGWSTTELARIGGWDHPKELQNILYARRYVYRVTAQRIARLYDSLSMQLGPSEQTRRRAERSGFAPPLAWDCPDTDPEPRGIRVTDEPRDLLIEWAELEAAGESIEQAAARLGVTVGAIERAHFRAKRKAVA